MRTWLSVFSQLSLCTSPHSIYSSLIPCTPLERRTLRPQHISLALEHFTPPYLCRFSSLISTSTKLVATPLSCLQLRTFQLHSQQSALPASTFQRSPRFTAYSSFHLTPDILLFSPWKQQSHLTVQALAMAVGHVRWQPAPRHFNRSPTLLTPPGVRARARVRRRCTRH